jgi:hypothetical protein
LKRGAKPSSGFAKFTARKKERKKLPQDLSYWPAIGEADIETSSYLPVGIIVVAEVVVVVTLADGKAASAVTTCKLNIP